MDALISLNNKIPVVYVNTVFVFINSFQNFSEYRKKTCIPEHFRWYINNLGDPKPYIFYSIYFRSTLRSQLRMFDEQYSMRKRSKRKETTSGDPIVSYVYVWFTTNSMIKFKICLLRNADDSDSDPLVIR